MNWGPGRSPQFDTKCLVRVRVHILSHRAGGRAVFRMATLCLSLLLGVHGAVALQAAARGNAIIPSRGCIPRVHGAAMALNPWEEVHGCQVLRPAGTPRALLHFVGGVFVSPAPQVAYRYMLESLADAGYLVVATPFKVDFDYRKPAAEVHGKFTAAQLELNREFGELPQLAAGHSLGALMQVLLCTLYPEYGQKTCASALISYNNKPASDAIPLFEQAFIPLLAPLEPLTRNPTLEGAMASVQQLRSAAFGLAREVSRRGSDEVADAAESAPALSV